MSILGRVRVRGVLIIPCLLLAAVACGGSQDSEGPAAVEPLSEVVREAGDDVQMVGSCPIEPNAQCPGANLSVAEDLSGADLSGANLSKANLSGLDLFFSNFTGADLQGANLSNANLTIANFSQANLQSADLRGADFEGSDLTGANLQGANVTGADLQYATFSNTVMPDGSVRNS
jgi:hypothetical protein